ncbi:thiamine pyrophosphate-dependent dehydrogenase E1 component subunit alpha [Desulforhopalus singaporensis]|uniref:Pyruvate dehydrogenase E1 component alpha subunit n=1 Tax=Desulforhopalus singaporensis TaxID=91360 RepID=A0A1H0VK59_9BACT|nr:thiamine pyrophosphate-dependent dehydrogenase E1 component subunit alpha [Desulforhopalus singaporensis]SDP78897.1 pyruvate dehydrogenase E1 component alpha subunit [Desulforhopalus singaporensis]
MTYKVSKEILDAFPCYEAMDNAPEDLSLDDQMKMYYLLNLIREHDSKLKELWMANKMCGIAHSYAGHEAIAVGACMALAKDDYITSTHRGHGHVIAKGGDVRKTMAEIYGRVEGYNCGKGGSMHIADVEQGILGAAGIVGSAMALAVGAAYSSVVLNKKSVTVCFHGDGGTSQGVWHESINMAGCWKLPVIFLTENNYWAVGTEFTRVAAQPEVYKRAVAYDIPGILTDGFNPFAVYKAVKSAAERARAGQGPTLIEARLMRIVGHWVADDESYRDPKAMEVWWQLDPIARMKHYLIENNVPPKSLEEIELRAKNDISDAVEYAENQCNDPTPDTLFKDLYANDEII